MFTFSCTFIMNYYKVLVVGDSRMRHLEAFLNNTSLNIRYTVITLPGATLHRIAAVAIRTLQDDYSYHLTIIAGGINDLTMVRHLPVRHARPRHNSPTYLVRRITREMRNCIENVYRHSYMPVALATLSGMNLSQYSPSLHHFLYTYQPIIDQAIVQINHQIRGINRLNSLRSADLSSAVNRCAGHHGRYRTHYSYLYDGLHPGYILRRTWAQNIHTYCANVFPELTHVQRLLPHYIY